MHFINRLRSAKGIAGCALVHPLAVIPLVIQIPHDRRGARRLFVHQTERIGFIDVIAVAVAIRYGTCKERLC